MKIKNPTEKDLKLNYKGQDYTLEAGFAKEFPEDVAAQWIVIYEFLSISRTTDKETDEVVKEAKKVPKKTTSKSK